MTVPSDIQRAQKRFADAGLVLPPIPHDLAPRLKERSDWCFSTKPLSRSPYAFEEYLQDGTKKSVRDFLVLAHAGHGVNSYALSYYLVRKPLRLFLQVAWGGVYMDQREATEEVNRCIGLAESLVAAVDRARQTGILQTKDRLIVAASSFYGGYWCKPGDEPPPGIPKTDSASVQDLLEAALQWVTGLRG